MKVNLRMIYLKAMEDLNIKMKKYMKETWKIGTYYLSSKVIIDIVIENDILNGIYKINDEEKYINNIDLNVIEEKDMLENIEKYLNDNINHHNYS